MHIRTLQPSEVSLFREIRLRALAKSPDAFAETLQQAQAQPNLSLTSERYNKSSIADGTAPSRESPEKLSFPLDCQQRLRRLERRVWQFFTVAGFLNLRLWLQQ